MREERCWLCDGKADLLSEERELQIGTRKTRALDEFFRCSECGEEFYLPDMMDATQRRACEKIRADEDLLQSSEIRAIRETLGLTQHDFERLLRVGPKTVVRWEQGMVFQNRATDTLLRVIREFPDVARFLAERSGVSLPRSAA